MITTERFIVESWHKDEWLTARTNGVTATAVAEAATPSGFATHVASWDEPPFTGNVYTDFGTESEHVVMQTAHHDFGILPSAWLIASESDARWLGTPDGLNPAHTEIAEAKTGGTIPKSVPRQHRDQCLWNMWVTGTTRCLYLFQHRTQNLDGTYSLGLWEPLTFWVDRDDNRISELVTVAERLMEEKMTWRTSTLLITKP